jgi:hypothetical protein
VHRFDGESIPCFGNGYRWSDKLVLAIGAPSPVHDQSVARLHGGRAKLIEPHRFGKQ